MKKKLSRSGSGWALFMPKTLLELVDVNPETDMLEVKVENDVIKITKAVVRDQELVSIKYSDKTTKNVREGG